MQPDLQHNVCCSVFWPVSIVYVFTQMDVRLKLGFWMKKTKQNSISSLAEEQVPSCTREHDTDMGFGIYFVITIHLQHQKVALSKLPLCRIWLWHLTFTTRCRICDGRLSPCTWVTWRGLLFFVFFPPVGSVSFPWPEGSVRNVKKKKKKNHIHQT